MPTRMHHHHARAHRYKKSGTSIVNSKTSNVTSVTISNSGCLLSAKDSGKACINQTVALYAWLRSCLFHLNLDQIGRMNVFIADS